MKGRPPTNYAKNVVACKLWGLVESPTEMILGLALFEELTTLYAGWHCWVHSESELKERVSSPAEWHSRRQTFVLVPQLNIADVGRVDFAIFVPQLVEFDGPLVVAECDGHEFHERTPDQASNDRRRIRALQRLGITVLPFTGTDVVGGSVEAAFEVAEILNVKLDEKWAQKHIEFEHSCLEQEHSYQAREIEELRREVEELHTRCQWSELLGVAPIMPLLPVANL